MAAGCERLYVACGHPLLLPLHLGLSIFLYSCPTNDRLCGLVVRVSGYRYRGPGFDPRRYQIF